MGTCSHFTIVLFFVPRHWGIGKRHPWTQQQRVAIAACPSTACGCSSSATCVSLLLLLRVALAHVACVWCMQFCHSAVCQYCSWHNDARSVCTRCQVRGNVIIKLRGVRVDGLLMRVFTGSRNCEETSPRSPFDRWGSHGHGRCCTDADPLYEHPVAFLAHEAAADQLARRAVALHNAQDAVACLLLNHIERKLPPDTAERGHERCRSCSAAADD